MERLIIPLLFSVPLAAAFRSAYRPCERCVDRATPTVLAGMELRLYTGTTPGDYTSVRIGEASKLLDEMDKSKPTVVYVSGWLTNPDKRSVADVVSAYLSRRDHNVVVLDWRLIAGQLYPYTLSSVNGVGYTLATALNELVRSGVNASGLSLVGHSFGAQISGYAGRYVDFRLPRITGLDPAGPGFYGVEDRLSSGDAEFVVVVHTDVFLYGLRPDIATADFYPNGGSRPQPGCGFFGLPLFGDKDFCSHNRAVGYFAESVRNEAAFPSLKCDSYAEFQAGSCRSNDRVVMGFGTPSTARGKFYLQTNKAPLYDRGEEGLTYRTPDIFVNEILNLP